jgi:hypothetical protein
MGFVDSYRLFLQHPFECKEHFLDAILSYPFDGDWQRELDNCAEMRLAAAFWPADGVLYTNTGQPYEFGPLLGWWIDHLEKALEGSPRQTQLSVNLSPFQERLQDNYIVLNPFWAGWDERLIDYCRETKRRSLLCSAHVLLPLARSHIFLDFCAQGGVDTIIATGEPACFDVAAFRQRGVVVNDKMLNWRTGANFFTCPYQRQHCVPLWGYYRGLIYNLINLAVVPGVINDDEFIFGPKCGCGRISVRVRPHAPQLPTVNYESFLAFVARLQGQYLNVQLVEWPDGRQEVLYTHLDGPDDLETTLPCRRGLLAKIGRKRPALSRMDYLKPVPLTEETFWTFYDSRLLVVSHPYLC